MRNVVSHFVKLGNVRHIVKFLGVCVFLIAFIPNVLMAATCELTDVRAALQPNGKTRIVIETSTKPSYKLLYFAEPDRLVIDIAGANGSARASIGSDSLIKSINISDSGKDLRIIAHLKRPINEIPKNNIMILSPNGDTDYRLVLDFAAGAGAANATASSGKTNTTTETPAKTNKRKPIIVIDAGHGGKDPGCIGRKGVKEKNVVFSVAKKLGNKLEKSGYQVYLTRTTDEFLNLDTRSGIAEKRKADLFISIHANANPSRSMKGMSIYTLSKKASDAEAEKLADAENAADKIDVDNFKAFEPDVRNALSALQQHAVAQASVEFADTAIKFMKRNSITIQPGPNLRSANFAVLRSTIPSVLAEIGHLSNADEEKLLNTESYQNKLVDILVRAVNDYDFEM